MARPGVPHRGFELLKQVGGRITARRKDVLFVLCGMSEPEEPGFPNKDLGVLPQEDLPQAYSDCDVVFDPSSAHGFGRPGVEAMACGVPCVLADSGGVREYAVEGENALLVPSGDADAAASAIERVLDDAVLARRLRENGLETVRRYDDAVAAAEFRAALPGSRAPGPR
jgi:glycosyltransferase involved in cell wall biosynthesis